MMPPEFLLQDEKGALHGYWDADILRIHLHENASAVKKYNWESTGPGGCDTHCIESPCGPCIIGSVKPMPIRVFSRDHRVPTVKYTEADCWECFDHEGKEPCQECCPHSEYDHGICLDCSLDRSEELAGEAESLYEGDR